MNEENSSSMEVSYSLTSHLVKYKKRMLLIPFGYPFNFDFMEKAGAGDIVALGNGTLIRILHKTTINVVSSIAEILAWALYEKPMKEVFKDFADEYGEDNINNEEVIVIAYELV